MADLWDFAEPDAWERPPAPPPAPPATGPMTPRPYQFDVTDRAAAQGARGKRRGIIQGETGSGKTVCGAIFCQRAHAKGNRTLVIADRRRLVKQFGGTLGRFGLEYGVVMSGVSRSPHAPIVLASRDTLDAWHESGHGAGAFQLVIVDECHRAMGNVYRRLLASFPGAFHLGLTATPARGDGRSLGDFYQFIECTVPPSQLIREGFLVQPEVFAPLELAGKRKRGDNVRGLAGDPVAHWRAHADGLATIAYSRSVAESHALRDLFLAAGIPAEHVDGSYDDDEREAAFARLVAGDTMVLCSVKLLIEGIDIPEVAAAILWAPFGSLVEYRQACGRTMRPGKPRAVILDHAGAAGLHGLPGDDVDWTLDATGKAKVRPPGDPADPKPVACKGCGRVYHPSLSAGACPACGARPPRPKPPRGAAAAERARDEALSRYQAEGAADREREHMQRFWKRCVGMAANAGSKAGRAAAMFSAKFGKPPWACGVSPLPEGRDAWQRPAAEVFPGFVRQKAGV